MREFSSISHFTERRQRHPGDKMSPKIWTLIVCLNPELELGHTTHTYSVFSASLLGGAIQTFYRRRKLREVKWLVQVTQSHDLNSYHQAEGPEPSNWKTFEKHQFEKAPCPPKGSTKSHGWASCRWCRGEWQWVKSRLKPDTLLLSKLMDIPRLFNINN